MTYDINTITFLDIETIPRYDWLTLPEKQKEFFQSKFQRELKEFKDPIIAGTSDKGITCSKEFGDFYHKKASLHAEFNQIVCVALGAMVITAGSPVAVTPTVVKNELFIRGFTGTEADILKQVAESLKKRSPSWICAHNGIGFDFPILARKYLLYDGLANVPILDVRNYKTYDLPWLDTQKIWAAGEWKYFVALDQLASLFGLPSPKDNMSGDQVYDAFKAGKIEDIKRYCQGDVATLANLFLKMNSQPIYTPEQIVYR